MVTVGFLIMISPLITITYSIDKIGDGKAQALNAWLKELVYNILIQPFYCVLFLAFYSTIAKIIKSSGLFEIGPYIFAIVVMQFMKKAEDILRKIFHFEASSMSSMSESGQNLMNATGKFVGVGMAAGGAFANFKAAGGVKAAKENFQNFKTEMLARSATKKDFKKEKKNAAEGTSIKNQSFSDYLKTDKGQEKLAQFKEERSASSMAAKAEINRNKRREKREQKVKEKAETQLREEMGDEAYEKLKARADGGDKNAQKVISDKEDKVRQGSFPKRTINGVAKGVSSVAGNVSEGAKRFAQSDYGKLVGAAAKDSMKIATAIGMGAFALGATGELNDAISLGQTGYGLAKGYLENSSKTLSNDSTEKAKKLAEIRGVDINDPEAMKNMLNVVYNQGQMGNQLDAKSLTNALDKLQEKIMNALGDKEDARRITADLIRDLQVQMVDDNSKLDIDGLFNAKLKDYVDDDEKKELNGLAQTYTDIFLASKIYSNQSTGEKVNVDHLEHDDRVVNKISS